jgi:1,4-dihydroxy-2-naphthoate octaprenyltransferase
MSASSRLRALIRLARPLHLLLIAITYFLGAGVARYLGKPQTMVVFWLGLWGVWMAQLSLNLLAEAFRPFNEPLLEDETRSERRFLRDAALYLSFAALSSLAFIAFLFYRQGHLTLPVFLFLALSLTLIVAYAVPPLRLLAQGFGEFLLALHIAYISPTLAFLLQAGEFHRLLNSLTVPLTLLALATFLALDFPAFATDLKYERRTFLTRLGWERAVPFHHALVLVAYLLLAVGPFFGFSLGVLWPAFLSLPFALLQMFWLRNIAQGARPIWRLFSTNAVAVLGLTAYFLTLTFWLR